MGRTDGDLFVFEVSFQAIESGAKDLVVFFVGDLGLVFEFFDRFLMNFFELLFHRVEEPFREAEFVDGFETASVKFKWHLKVLQ